MMREQRREQRSEQRYFERFDRFHRASHILLMVSFLGLALTGLPLRFADQTWAAWLARAFGGFVAAGIVHRLCALLLIGVFTAHLGRLAYRAFVRRERGLFWGPSSMIPQPRDLREMVAHVRWFVGRGPRPRFDHFTYWEKFDYWAVFWGMFIIGGSGLMLWFPTFFARFMPGWVFNVAMLIHGEEALLAVGFIFTIHFFNGHLRPEKFPMDLVAFTGRVSEHELAEERPAEADRLRGSGHYEALATTPPSARSILVGRLLGTTAVTIGILTVALILYALVR